MASPTMAMTLSRTAAGRAAFGFSPCAKALAMSPCNFFSPGSREGHLHRAASLRSASSLECKSNLRHAFGKFNFEKKYGQFHHKITTQATQLHCKHANELEISRLKPHEKARHTSKNTTLQTGNVISTLTHDSLGLNPKMSSEEIDASNITYPIGTQRISPLQTSAKVISLASPTAWSAVNARAALANPWTVALPSAWYRLFGFRN
jgi:hypothetical protein